MISLLLSTNFVPEGVIPRAACEGYTGAFTGSALRTRRRAPPSLSPRGNRHTAAAPFYRRSRLVLGCIAYFHTPALRCAKERQNQGM